MKAHEQSQQFQRYLQIQRRQSRMVLAIRDLMRQAESQGMVPSGTVLAYCQRALQDGGKA